MTFTIHIRTQNIKDQLVNSTSCGLRPYINANRELLFESLVAENDHFSTIKQLAKEGEFPWVGYLIVQKKDGLVGTCTVSLISHYHAITAAHCVSQDYEWAVVAFGQDKIDIEAIKFSSANLNFFGLFIPWARYVVKADIHYAYSHEKNIYDLAVLTFDYPIEFTDKIQPICLVHEPDLDSTQNAITAGWGRYEDNYDSFSIDLRMGTTNLWPDEECKNIFESEPEKWSRVICYGSKYTTHTHEGDSGGPLLVQSKNRRWKQIGVNSFYARNSITQKHEVDAASRLDCGWIEAITGITCL